MNANQGYSVYYLTDTDDHPEGYGGKEAGAGSGGPSQLKALDYKTGKVVWSHQGGAGRCSPRRVMFCLDRAAAILVAFNAANGKISVWHSGIDGYAKRADYLHAG